MNITLIGFMGTGKTAVGRRLAQRLRRRFIDVDAWIEARERRSITEIFRRYGEPRFRRLERAAIARLVCESNAVLATGGGAVIDPANLAHLKRTGPVICLSASPRTIVQRIGRSEHRPLFAQADRQQLIALLRRRSAAYAQADWAVDTTDRSISDVARLIQAYLEKTVGIVYLPPHEELVHVSPLSFS